MNLIYQTISSSVRLRTTEDQKTVTVLYQDRQIARFGIELVWDGLKDALASLDATENEPGLFRRKNEAQEARNYVRRHGGLNGRP